MHKNIKYLLFILLFWHHAQTHAQSAVKIGESIPDALWTVPLQVVNHPQDKKTVTLSDYKDKLIILDFWATWCTPCISSFPKLHAFQNQFGDKIKVLAVTRQSTDEITRFFKIGAGKEYSYVNSVINDSTLSKYFPHIGIPHLVWITPNGTLLNTTQAEEVTAENIQSILDDKKTEMVSKIDIDKKRPLFLSEHFTDNLKIKYYSIFLRGYYPGLSSGNNFKRTKEGKLYGRQMTNASMMSIYYPILDELFNRNKDKFNSKRMIIDVKEPTLLHIIKQDGKSDKSNFYNYELIVPEEKADSLYHYMLADLNRYSDYTGAIEKRKVDCIVLKRTSKQDKIKSKGGKPKFSYSKANSVLVNSPLSYLLNRINGDERFTNLPIIDETGYTDNVDIEISGITDLESLKKELNRYDLDLKPAKRSLNMFVVKDK